VPIPFGHHIATAESGAQRNERHPLGPISCQGYARYPSLTKPLST